MLHEPDRIEAHLVGEHALLDRLLDHRVVVDHRALHLEGETQSHVFLQSIRGAPGTIARWIGFTPGILPASMWMAGCTLPRARGRAGPRAPTPDRCSRERP